MTGDPRNRPAIIGVVVGADGRVAPIPTPIPLTDAMRAQLGAVRPERAFRLAGPCGEGACAQWSGDACSLIGRMRALLDGDGEAPPGAPLPPCGIRADCRWWAQEGPAACRVCPRVAYNPSDG